jgi:hypothetical protein
MHSDSSKTVQIKFPLHLHTRLKVQAVLRDTSIRRLILQTLERVAVVEHWGVLDEHDNINKGAAA